MKRGKIRPPRSVNIPDRIRRTVGRRGSEPNRRSVIGEVQRLNREAPHLVCSRGEYPIRPADGANIAAARGGGQGVAGGVEDRSCDPDLAIHLLEQEVHLENSLDAGWRGGTRRSIDRRRLFLVASLPFDTPETGSEEIVCRRSKKERRRDEVNVR